MTLVTRDPATGLRHSGIRHPNGQPPTPFGCRWCGTEDRSHGRTWTPSVGMHAWQRPTNAQITARMQARRTARLNAAPPKYHATTGWAPDHTCESADPYCADCKTDSCPRWARVQDRLDEIRWGIPRPSRTRKSSGAGWGGGEPF